MGNERVVGTVTRKRMAPPPCLVRFRCPKCFGETVEDAYDGPVTHETCGVFMVPVTVVVDGKPPLRNAGRGVPFRG